eukprot:1635999-Pleurochrysis_carterae.AAC.2
MRSSVGPNHPRNCDSVSANMSSVRQVLSFSSDRLTAHQQRVFSRCVNALSSGASPSSPHPASSRTVELHNPTALG